MSNYFDRTIKAPPPDKNEEVLEALKRALIALNTAPRFEIPALEIDSYMLARHIDRVIKKAEIP